jgi:type I restriction enzyme S subunit
MSSDVLLNLCRLGDIGEFKNGANFSQEDYGPGFPIVNVKQLYGGRYVELDGLESLGKEVLKRPEQLFLAPGDILFARSSVKRSGAGQCALVPEGVVITIFSGFIIRYRLTDKSATNPMFLSYLLQSPVYREIFPRIATGTTISNLSQEALKGVEVNLPDKATQDQVAEMLGALDDRITLLRETNATLEAIAQALFKSWFVDFDPVRAKMEGRAPEGMDEATAALFPDSFEETELGVVPRGWEVHSLDEIATYLNGLALQKFPPTGQDDLPVIKIAQLRKGDTVGADMASRSIKPEYVIQNGDVLFSWSGSLEVEIWCGGEGALNQHLFKVTSEKFPKWFYYLWTRHHLEHFRQVAASKATTMGHIQRSHLTAAQAIVPTEKVLLAANAVLQPIIERLVENALQAQNLSNVRDTLLPRLISGQLQLSEVVDAS